MNFQHHTWANEIWRGGSVDSPDPDTLQAPMTFQLHIWQMDFRGNQCGLPESHASELAIQLRQNLANGLRSAGGGGNDVGACSAASPPVLHSVILLEHLAENSTQLKLCQVNCSSFLHTFLEGPSTVFCVAVVAWTVVIKPSLMPNLSLMTWRSMHAFSGLI